MSSEEVFQSRNRISKLQRDRLRSSSRLKWNNVSQDNDPVQTPSLKVHDYDPGYALRKIALLYEKNQNEEVADLINNLSSSTLNKIYSDFPMDMFIDGIPHTLCIINSLYSRIFLERPNNFPIATLPFGGLTMQIVKLYARSLSTDLPKLKDWDSQKNLCRNILKIIGYVDGLGILKMLRHRRRCLNRALEGLGEHGIIEVETSPIGEEEVRNELMALPVALNVELDRMITNCKVSIQKLHRTTKTLSGQNFDMLLNSSVSRLFSLDSNKNQERHSFSIEQTSQCNHQRVMEFTSTNIQDRLYKNKAILNIIEPTMNYAQLPKLVSILQDRIECDKDLLLTFSQLRKEIVSVPADAKLAPFLNHYYSAFNLVIIMLKEFVADDVDTSDTASAGDLSNSFDSSVVNHTLQAFSNLMDHSSSQGLRNENDRLQQELQKNKKLIEKLKMRERELVKRLSKQAQQSFDGGSGVFEDLGTSQTRPSELAKIFQNLYSDGRLQALDALEETWGGKEHEIMKAKLLFTVTVLSFRSATDLLDSVQHQLHEIISASSVGIREQENIVHKMKKTFGAYLRQTTDSYDLSQNVEDVCHQVFQALDSQPNLSRSDAIKLYIKECVRIAWAIVVQSPGMFLEYDAGVFDPQKHDRFHTSDRASDNIVSYLWPSLLEKQSGKCVAKGIVITGV